LAIAIPGTLEKQSTGCHMEPFGEHSENEAHFSDSERNEMNDLLLEEIPTTSTGVPFDFDKLSGSEIYDTFVGKEGKKHGAGLCARYVFTQLVRGKKHIHTYLKQSLQWTTGTRSLAPN